MTLAKDLMKLMMERFGGVIDLKEQPEVLDELVAEVAKRIKTADVPATRLQPSAAPFGVDWMDSWVAHWVYADNVAKIERREREVATVLRGLADLRFRERLDEIKRVIAGSGFTPDGGPPEPGTPPVGPAGIAGLASEPGPPSPDAGPGPAGPAGIAGRASEPGTPDPPDGGPPEPGPPAPAGPEPGVLTENPWILYWFVSLRAPLLLDVIDLHLTRRLEALQGSK